MTAVAHAEVATHSHKISRASKSLRTNRSDLRCTPKAPRVQANPKHASQVSQHAPTATCKTHDCHREDMLDSGTQVVMCRADHNLNQRRRSIRSDHHSQRSRASKTTDRVLPFETKYKRELCRRQCSIHQAGDALPRGKMFEIHVPCLAHASAVNDDTSTPFR